VKISYSIALFAVILLEGYVVLSSELIAMRLTLPFIGSGTDTVSIIIAAVLMPLAFGYQSGGRFKPHIRNGKYFGVRDKLISNMIISSVILLFGLSYYSLNIFFLMLMEAGVTHRLLLVTIYSAIFLVTPVYLLGQTIPLCSNYFSKARLARITGSILFFSTMGSFLGAVFSTLVLMALIGVHYTAALNFVILFLLVALLSPKKQREKIVFSFGVMMVAIFMNSGDMMRALNIVENNQYNTIAIYEMHNGNRHLIMNNSDSSMFNDNRRKHDYVEFIERVTINALPIDAPPKNVLVVGAGAFTYGVDDEHNLYDYLDMDGSLLRIAEDYILKEPLKENKTFHPVEARAYLASAQKKYDIIFLDAYFGDRTIPEYLVTKEFFEQIRAALNPGGVVVANFIVSPNFQSVFSQKVDNTFRLVFPHVNRMSINEEYKLWDNDHANLANVIYLYRDVADHNTRGIYTDNKNTIFYDKPQRR
jgi:spermidine synthase